MSDARAYIDGAVRAARWIEAQRTLAEHGAEWPGDPSDPASVSNSLYSGTAGIVAFFLELNAATSEPSYIACAVHGATSLVARLSDEAEVGLYSGLAGMGMALDRVGSATGESKFEKAADWCSAQLVERAVPVGDGVEWPVVMPDASGQPTGLSMCTDIIAGSAGIGLWLLDVARRRGDNDLVETAAAAGRRLLQCGQAVGDGLDWPMSPALPYRMPNFSHGTAGVTYFLASLAMATGEQQFLDAAVRGGRFLQSVAVTEGDVCLIRHSDNPAAVPGGDGRARYALSWCHGPSGTGATWYRLYQATGDERWLGWLSRSARALVPGRAPASLGNAVSHIEPPGTWSSFCYCHGSAGNGDFLLNVYRVTGDELFGDVAHRMIDDCLAQATEADGGYCWPQNGVRFDDEGTMVPSVFPQAGFATGAAGIGFALLRFAAHAEGRPPAVALPDWPFADVW